MTARNIQDIYPLSPMQQGMLFHSLLAPESGVYVEQMSCVLHGDLHVTAFERAWQRVVERHTPLRAAFLWEEVDEPVQVVQRQLRVPVRYEDWRAIPAENQQRQLHALMAAERSHGFDMAAAPLMRIVLLRLADDAHALIWSHHHLLLDGWSVPLLLQEVFALYEAAAQGRELRLPPVRPYRDYIAWLQRQDPAAAEAFWRRTLAGFTAPTPLATRRDHALTHADLGNGEQHYSLDATTTAALQDLARRNQVTLSTLIQGAWALLLSRYADEDDVVFGTTVSGRPAELSGADQMVGLFINTLPVRIRIPADVGLGDWLQILQALLVEMRQFEYSPLVRIQEWSDVPRGQPLFESMVVVENYPVDERLRQSQGSLRIDTVESISRTNYPLMLVATPGRELALDLVYDRAQFAEPAITRMLGHLATLLSGFAAGFEQHLGDLPLLTPAEQHLLLHTWTSTAAPFPADRCIHELFEQQAAQQPEAIAAWYQGQSLSYGELNRRANQLARHLRACGIGPETMVAISADPSIEILVGVLGVLKAGGAYIPLDPNYPAERLAYMLNDARPPVLLVNQGSLEQRYDARVTEPGNEANCAHADGTRVVIHARQTAVINLTTTMNDLGGLPDDNLPALATSSNLAYVIYTSGSTGKPKGVLLQHRGLVNLILAQVRDFEFDATRSGLLFASFSFDASVSEIFTALVSGARLVMAPRDLLADVGRLIDLLREQRVTNVTMPPSLLAILPDTELPDLRTITSAGERLPVEVAAHWARGRRLINAYGPTETTLGPCWHIVTETEGLSHIPIGRAIPNVQIYIVDAQLRPVPIGVPGELVVGGVGLARGYLNRPELTAEKFVAAPGWMGGLENRKTAGPYDRTSERARDRGAEQPPGAPTEGSSTALRSAGPAVSSRLYRTGDLARWREDGLIEYLGRIDFQVKIRGFRIELGEIETLLRHQPGVQDVVVLAREEIPGDRRLVAYLAGPELVAGEPRERITLLREALRHELPDYMVPAAFVLLERMPISPNGKIDRRALPAPDMAALDQEYVAPRTPEEELIANLWRQVLRLDRVSVHDNFFDLGGHSLLATQLLARMREAFQVDLPLRALFEAPSVAGMALRVVQARRAAAGVSQPAISPVPRHGELPLSFAQQRLWFLDQLEPESPFYNNPAALRLSGDLDVAALDQAINAIVARHEALRTVFAVSGGRPRQVVLPELRVPLAVTDLRDVPPEQREAEARRLATLEARTPFNMATGPLLRAQLIRLHDTEYLALVTLHHIVSDGWSIGVLIREIATLYAAFRTGQPDPLPPLPIQYPDYAAWQRQWLQGDVLATQLDYWTRQLAGAPEILNLPTDRPRPPIQTASGASFSFDLPADLGRQVAALSQREGVTLFMTLLAAFQTLLYRYSGQEDICVGTPIAGRTRAETEGLIGFFVNTLVIRSELAADMPFRTLLARVREAALGAYAHQELPFETLVEALQPARNLSHTPLFQVMFVLDNAPVEALRLPGLTVQPLDIDSGTARFDLTLSMTGSPQGLSGMIEYNTDLFDQATIARMVQHFGMLLGGITAAPETTLGQLPLLTAAERHTLLVAWNQTDTPLPPVDAWHQLFEQQARTTPDALAVRFQGQELTYAQLDARANQLAHALLHRGVGPEHLVGICATRSIELVVGILGTLKAGGAFLPLDPAYPAGRLAFMLNDAQPAVLLTLDALRSRFALDGGCWMVDGQHGDAPGATSGAAPTIVALDTEWPAIAGQPATTPTVAHTLDQLAYVIFTSGSTGRPKGTLLHHRGLLNLAVAQQRAFAQQPGHRVLQFSALSFDAAVWELVMALSAGAALILAPQDQLSSPPELLRLLRREQITTATLPPSLLAVLPPADLPAFTTVIAAGEACSAALVQAWATPDRRVFNAYGPTETTVCATMHHADPADPRDPPIGRPLPNFRAYVLDRHRQPVPLGVPGELVVAGIGVARGYLNRPELTAAQFIPDPAGGPQRAYCTGDLVRQRPDGTLEFLGRIDHQVKLRGFRIELGEIEAALRQQPGVQDALVLARDLAPGDTRLVAYLVGSELPDVGALRAALRTRLPEFMLPAAAVALERWPLTPGGKIDRRALPLPEGSTAREYVAPRTETEAVLAALCAGLLGLPEVGVTASFFELGGHSLLATQLLARVQEQLGVEVPLRALFEQPTVAGLALAVEQARLAGEAPAAPEIVRVSRDARRVRRSVTKGE